MDHFLLIVKALCILFCLGSTVLSGSNDICDVCRCEDDGQTLKCITEHLNTTHLFCGFPVYTNITTLKIYDGDGILELRNNTIGSHFPRLHEVSFSCSISVIDSGVFEGMPYLKKITFYRNGLYEIPISALAPVANSLTDLEISDQERIYEIPAGGFGNFSNLLKLKLSINTIRYLNSDSLLGLNNLRDLNLEANKIRRDGCLRPHKKTQNFKYEWQSDQSHSSIR